VKILEDAAWPGMRHFDAHAYRTEDRDGVWDFAAGCMRTYLILKEKVKRFNADPEIQGLLQSIHEKDAKTGGLLSKYSAANAKELRALALDRKALAARKLPYEKLDQLLVDLLLGVR
jgi:xylose isomerase